MEKGDGFDQTLRSVTWGEGGIKKGNFLRYVIYVRPPSRTPGGTRTIG